MKHLAKLIAVLLVVGGTAAVSYLKIPTFREIVDEFVKKFRADMAQREDELIEALSSTEEEVETARSTWEDRQARRGRHSAPETTEDDDLIFD